MFGIVVESLKRSLPLALTAWVLCLAASPAAQALTVTRGPYLQMLSEDGVVVRWSTDTPSDTRLRYGPHPANLPATVDDAVSSTDHVVVLTGLTRGTRYYYSVGSTTETAAGADADHFFVTAPAGGSAKSTRIWVLGDSGQGGLPAEFVRDAYYNFTGTRETDLWLMLGDNAYPFGTEAEYQAKLFEVYPETLRSSPLWPTIGNHDLFDAGNQTWPYFDLFVLPGNGEVGGVASGTEAYYSFDYANVHFVVLDSSTYPGGSLPAGEMLVWLQADLAATDQRWVVTYFHHPPYTKGSHDSDDPTDSNGRLVDMREHVVPILEDHAVDLVLSGHSHSYERSYLIHGHHGDSSTWVEGFKIDGGDGREDGTGAYDAEGDGTVYTVAGSSSQTLGGTFDHPAMYTWKGLLGSLVLDVSGNRLDVSFVDATGAAADHFTLTKGSCDGDGVCGPGEDCFNCPADCPATGGAVCGNGLCEAGDGEDCLSCAADCRGKQNGNPANRYCCGDGAGQNPVSADDARCTANGFWITTDPAIPACCGDAVCHPTEDSCACEVDCGIDPLCNVQCLPKGEACTHGSDCCSGKCRGSAGSKTCK